MSSSKLSLKDKLHLEELSQRFFSLAPREQLAVLIGIGLLVIFLLVLPITCASSKLSELENEMQDHQKNVAKIQQKIKEYESAQALLHQLESSTKSSSQVQLTTLIESLANKHNIGSKIERLDEKEKETGEGVGEKTLSVSMSQLSLSQLVEFFYFLEDQKDLKLKIQRLELKPRYDNRRLFDVTFEVVTLVSL
ncbi:MAG: type II secretion system protein M [Deltaproteobacteria bacterium]|nr:type II secretion system protein M [Deltaproteobacteria bacterium]